MTENEFHFKESADMNDLAKTLGESLGKTMGSNPVLMSSGLFVKGFTPEDWDDDHAD
jgi:hypothetical protein